MDYFSTLSNPNWLISTSSTKKN